MKIMVGDYLSKNLQKGVEMGQGPSHSGPYRHWGEGRVLPYFRPHSFFKASGLRQRN